jgi:hypothetical protein
MQLGFGVESGKIMRGKKSPREGWMDRTRVAAKGYHPGRHFANQAPAGEQHRVYSYSAGLPADRGAAA